VPKATQVHTHRADKTGKQWRAAALRVRLREARPESDVTSPDPPGAGGPFKLIRRHVSPVGLTGIKTKSASIGKHAMQQNDMP